jgi:hypothetical protein
MVAAAIALLYGLRPGWRILVIAAAAICTRRACRRVLPQVRKHRASHSVGGAAILSLSMLGKASSGPQRHSPEEFIHGNALQAIAEWGIGALWANG